MYGDLVDDVCMTRTLGYTSCGCNKVCKLVKSIYGLKQAQDCWMKNLLQLYMKMILFGPKVTILFLLSQNIDVYGCISLCWWHSHHRNQYWGNKQV